MVTKGRTIETGIKDDDCMVALIGCCTLEIYC